jgi:hypothetical protein
MGVGREDGGGEEVSEGCGLHGGFLGRGCGSEGRLGDGI